MTRQHRPAREEPAATYARLTAAALASHANACAVADAFLVDGTTPDRDNLPPDLVLAETAHGRLARIDADTPDERQFTSHEALRVYVKTCLVRSLTVRREGWTLPVPGDGRIEPDAARLVLHADKTADRYVTEIVARIGMDKSLDLPQLRHEDEHGRMQPFDHHAHDLDERGVWYVAGLFRTGE